MIKKRHFVTAVLLAALVFSVAFVPSGDVSQDSPADTCDPTWEKCAAPSVNEEATSSTLSSIPDSSAQACDPTIDTSACADAAMEQDRQAALPDQQVQVADPTVDQP